MLRLATDEDFNNRIVRGLLRRQPDLDVVRVQDAGLAGEKDEECLPDCDKGIHEPQVLNSQLPAYHLSNLTT